MTRKVDPINAAVRLRLSAAQIKILAPGIKLLVESYEIRQRSGSSQFTYPFRIFPPPPSFDRGCYHQSCMEKSLSLREALNTRSKSGQWVRVDTIELRAAIFAIRAYT